MDIIAKTHASVQNSGVGAQTADHWVRQRVRNGGCVQIGVLVCEEITQIVCDLFVDLCKFALAEGVEFILAGMSSNSAPFAKSG